MARIRQIKPEIHTDSKTGKLSPLGFKLLIGLLNQADDYGVIRLDLDEFKVRIMPYYTEEIEEVIGKPLYGELIPKKLVTQFTVNGKSYLFIEHFYDHQYVQHPANPILAGWVRGMTPDTYAASQGIPSAEVVVSIESAPVIQESHEPSVILMTPHAGKERVVKGSKGKGKEIQGTGSAFAPPDWVPDSDWRDFEEMRRRIRKPMTDKARSLIVGELFKLRNRGHPPAEVLQQSIRNGWQDVFQLREVRNGNGKSDSGGTVSRAEQRQQRNISAAQRTMEILRGEPVDGAGRGDGCKSDPGKTGDLRRGSDFVPGITLEGSFPKVPG